MKTYTCTPRDQVAVFSDGSVWLYAACQKRSFELSDCSADCLARLAFLKPSAPGAYFQIMPATAGQTVHDPREAPATNL